MKSWTCLIILLTMFVAGVTMSCGALDEGVDLDSVMEVWSDVVRDVDQLGLKATRVSDAREMAIGRHIKSQIVGQYDDPRLEYVRRVGRELMPFVRRKGIQYDFHVLPHYEPNAFAVPGGQIFVTTSFLEEAQSEAELAAVLGHEMAHVDARHCVERIQYEIALSDLGVDELALPIQIITGSLSAGYLKYQELEADLQGMRMAIEAGYDPSAALSLFSRIANRSGRSMEKHSDQPMDEVSRAVYDALSDYFATHPRPYKRLERLKGLLRSHASTLEGRDLYVGVENYRMKKSKSDVYLKSETRRFDDSSP